jgi:hypothetical protein
MWYKEKLINMKYCPYCGVKLSDDSRYCTECGKSVPLGDTRSQGGALYIRWDGRWSLWDAKMHVFVNGEEQGTFSFNRGFEIAVPITIPTMTILTKMAFRKKESVLTLTPSENYSYNLIYNTFSGSFNSALCDNEGTILETDKEPWWYYVFFFLIPIIGFIYSISMYKKKPAAAKDALILSFIGFIIAIILNIVKQM